MLIAHTQMTKAIVDSTDGEVGNVKDVIADADSWVVRYLLVDTTRWMAGREIPLSPADLANKDWGRGRIEIGISENTFKTGPTIEAPAPVSKQMEVEIAKQSQWPDDWAVGSPAAGAVVPAADAVEQDTKARIEEQQENLRSANEVLGYSIHALDGEIGSVCDLIVDDEHWVVRYVAIDTGNWLPGRKVLMSVNWADDISWTKKQMQVSMTLEQIEEAPTYDWRQCVNRTFEERLYDFHGRPRYWK